MLERLGGFRIRMWSRWKYDASQLAGLAKYVSYTQEVQQTTNIANPTARARSELNTS